MFCLQLQFGTGDIQAMGSIKRNALVQEESDRRPANLSDLESERVDVFCWCNRCGHNAVVPIENLIGLLGPAQPVPEVGVRMRCSACGAKDVAARPSWPSLGQVSNHN
tara:strand:+ start:130 stop:453 length:324 start_codon:yes stop_codon:yes gene_type:complete